MERSARGVGGGRAAERARVGGAGNVLPAPGEGLRPPPQPSRGQALAPCGGGGGGGGTAKARAPGLRLASHALWRGGSRGERTGRGCPLPLASPRALASSPAGALPRHRRHRHRGTPPWARARTGAGAPPSPSHRAAPPAPAAAQHGRSSPPLPARCQASARRAPPRPGRGPRQQSCGASHCEGSLLSVAANLLWRALLSRVANARGAAKLVGLHFDLHRQLARGRQHQQRRPHARVLARLLRSVASSKSRTSSRTSVSPGRGHRRPGGPRRVHAAPGGVPQRCLPLAATVVGAPGGLPPHLDVHHAGQQEAARLAAARLGNGDEVSARQRHGPGGGLDGRGRAEAGAADLCVGWRGGVSTRGRVEVWGRDAWRHAHSAAAKFVNAPRP